jgi:exodeoxyribonuclease VII small subunit
MSERGAKSSMSQETSFEVAFAELEAVVQQLEEGELSLEESITLYERGQALARVCQERLDQAELRVEQLEAANHTDEYGTDGLLC